MAEVYEGKGGDAWGLGFGLNQYRYDEIRERKKKEVPSH